MLPSPRLIPSSKRPLLEHELTVYSTYDPATLMYVKIKHSIAYGLGKADLLDKCAKRYLSIYSALGPFHDCELCDEIAYDNLASPPSQGRFRHFGWPDGTLSSSDVPHVNDTVPKMDMTIPWQAVSVVLNEPLTFLEPEITSVSCSTIAHHPDNSYSVFVGNAGQVNPSTLWLPVAGS